MNYKFVNINKCPLCNNKDYILWDNYAENEIKALECKKCALIYMDKILSNKDSIKYYDAYSSQRKINDKVKKIQRKKMYELDYNELSLFVLEKGSFLDIGCGEGDFFSFFQNIRKLGYDIDQTAILKGSKVNKDVEFLDSLESVKNKELNCVIFRGSLQYMRNINQSIKYSYDKLIDNGYLCIFSLPNTDSPLAILQRENWSICNKIEHIQLFNINSINFLLNNKFKILNISFPYLGTPYENHTNDLKLFTYMINNKSNAVKANFPFWGSFMNVVAKKI